MSLMQQISIPFLYALNAIPQVSEEIVQFWSSLDQFIRDLFDQARNLSDIPIIQERGRQIFKKVNPLPIQSIPFSALPPTSISGS